ncbi:MAG: NAD(P)H-dependent oxidoreductase [Clostridia bacterium]|nr:NAD(P)H-dependent oxidoreductase [Clostridia bacterium]
MSKTIVTYFSVSGVTAGKAEQLANIFNADLFEIAPKQKYSSADLDWRDSSSRSSVEMKDEKSRPEMAKNTDLSQYDTVFIGFPIWWYTAPHIINTFIESNDFSGKKVVLFATSGSTGIEKTVNDLQKQYPDINIAGGKLVNRSFSEKDFDF